jgi:hypothetical protein
MKQTMPIQVYGDFLDSIPACEEYLTLNFSPNSVPRKRRWSNYGLSADFLGDYFAAFFPGDAIPDSSINQRDTVKAAISYIANELLENAVKYNQDSAGFPISISLHLYASQIIFRVANYTEEKLAHKYQQFIRELLGADLDSYYMQQLERTANSGESSCMGILTMMNDYAARFGWKFEAFEQLPGTIRVEVLVYLDV